MKIQPTKGNAVAVKKNDMNNPLPIVPSQGLAMKLHSRIEVTSPDDCWLWMGYKTRGYGRFNWKGLPLLAHRASYVLSKGHPPAGYVIAHSCDVKACVNPAHLSAITQVQNVQDAKDRGLILSGEQLSTVLNESVVREIIRIHEDTGEGGRKIARRLGLKPSSVDGVLSGTSWKCVTGGVKRTKPRDFVDADTVKMIIDIRTTRGTGATAIARELGVSRGVVSGVILGRTWTKITGGPVPPFGRTEGTTIGG